MPTINGYSYYASVQKPVTKYQKDGSKNPLDYEYKVDVLVNADDYKTFIKQFKAQRKDPLTKDEFVARFKEEPPVDVKTNADDEYCMVTFKTNNAYTDYKSGKTVIMNKPKVFFKNAAGKLEEDTETLIGNGSKVLIQYNVYESKKWNSVSAKLHAMRVDSLVSYGGGGYDELGDIEESSLKDGGYGELEEDAPTSNNEDDIPFETDDDEY